MILVAVSPRFVNKIKNYYNNFLVNLSSMGGTDPSNFLNAVGKNPDGTGNGDILLWKRKAERYLVEVCFGCVDFNIYQVPNHTHRFCRLVWFIIFHYSSWRFD